MHTYTTHEIAPLIDALIAFVGKARLQKAVASWRNALQNARPAEREQQERSTFYWWPGLADYWHSQATGAPYTLATQLLAKDALKVRDLLPTMPDSIKRQFAGALGDVRNAPSHLHEISMAHHCHTLGTQIQWCEETGRGIPEFIAGLPELEFEVECKHCSPDKGRRVGRAEFARFAAAIEPPLRKSGVMGRAHFALHDGLPPSADHAHIAATLRSVVDAGLHVGHVDLTPWGHAQLDMAVADNVPIHWDLAQDAMRTSAPVQGHAFMHAERHADQPVNPIALTVASTVEDGYLQAIYGTMTEAAQRQLSGTRPGLLCMHIPEIADFGSLAENSALQQMTALFFSKPEYGHVFAVMYSSDAQIVNEPTGFQVISNALALKNPQCRFPQALTLRLLPSEALPPPLSAAAQALMARWTAPPA